MRQNMPMQGNKKCRQKNGNENLNLIKDNKSLYHEFESYQQSVILFEQTRKEVKLCSKSTKICFMNVPRWLWIIMIIAGIALIIVIAWKINASLKNTYEKKSVEKEERKEKRKDNFKDFEIDFHLRKHAQS